MKRSRQSTVSPNKRGKVAEVPRDSRQGGSLFQQRLERYALDIAVDGVPSELYNTGSSHFTRLDPPKFNPASHLPYRVPDVTVQSKYLCHVVVNLYAAISSLDIQGIVALNARDLAEDGSLGAVDINESDIATFDEAEENDDEEQQMMMAFADESGDVAEYIDELTAPDFNVSGKITERSESIVNVNHWTNELRNCLNSGVVPMPLTLRAALTTVYYHLALTQGQKIYRQLHVEILELLVNTDDSGTNFTKLLRDNGLVLDHTPMFQFLTQFLPYPDADFARYDIQSRDDLQLFRLLLKLAHLARPFFKEDAGEPILSDTLDFLLASFAPSTMSMVLPIINSYVPYHYSTTAGRDNILTYFPVFFSIWSSVSPGVAIDTHMYDFVGSVAEDFHERFLLEDQAHNTDTWSRDHFSEYGLFTPTQMSFLFNRLQGHLRADGQIHSYSRTVRPFVYSINPHNNTAFWRKLISLVKSIETFVHPSNTGFWTRPIAKFVHAFIKMYHGRRQRELLCDHTPHFALTNECHSKITSVFVEVLFTGSQNKTADVANYYISSMAYLLDLKPSNQHIIFDRVLTDIYDALAGEYIHSRHRIIASLKQFTRIVRYMTLHKIYRIHITNIMSLLVAKIDLNDINLTSNLLNGIVSITSFVPLEAATTTLPAGEDTLTFESHTLPFIEAHFIHLKCAKSTPELDTQKGADLEKLFNASTTIFENILRVYVEKLFHFVDVELEEAFITKLNQTTLLMIESMDNRTFKVYSELFQRVFWDNDAFREKDPNYELVSVALSAIVKRDPASAAPLIRTIFFNVKQQIERGAASVRSSSEIQKRDIRLVMFLNSLNDVLRQSHEALISIEDELIEFMKYLFGNVTNPPLDVITSIIVHSSLATLTTTELTEARLFPEESTLSTSEKWGALQFDERRFQIQDLLWHVPSKQEIDVAVNILNQMVDWCITKLEKLLESPQSDTVYCDQLQKYILIITHSLSGASLLFDPEFNELTRGKTASRGVRLATWDDDELGAEATDGHAPKLTAGADDDLARDEESADVVNKDTSPEDILIFDADDINGDNASEVPSGICTPAVPDTDDNDISDDLCCVNKSTGFKKLNIFACNYCFGQTEAEKLRNPLYFEVHKIRDRIGGLLHKVYLFLIEHHENNTIMNQIILHGMKVFFTDVGQETVFNEDSTATLDCDFLENIQSLAHVDKPYTRTLFAIKINEYHQSRVMLHSTNRYPSRLEKKLLMDIISLSISIYPDVYKPAQGTLVHCMKQVIGSYATIMGVVMTSLREGVKTQSHKKIEVVLKLLLVKKIHRKIMSDFKNLKDLVLLLIECCNINELDVGVLAERLLLNIVGGLKIPSSICVHDERMFTPIAPTDQYMAARVKAIRESKDNKRQYYLQLLTSLQETLLDVLNKQNKATWKIPIILVRFLSRLQSSLEISTNVKAVSLLHEQTREKHPDMVHLVVRSYLGIFNKIFSLSDYKYDISNAYRSSFDPSFVEVIQSSEIDFKKKFQAEMNNLEHPNFFIDCRPFVGWLCWGREMKVLKAEPVQINLKQEDINAVNCLGSLVSKQWLIDVTTTLVQDNESRTVFSSGNVSFFVLMIILITEKHTTAITLNDLFDLCTKYYDRYDKAAMIMSVEIFSSLLCGDKYMAKDELKARNTFASRFLKDCLNNELNQDAFEIWSTFCWWIPTLYDIRRCPPLFEIFSHVETVLDSNSDAAAHQAYKLLMLRSIAIGTEFRSPDMSHVIDTLIFDHPYDQVREAVAKLFVTLIQNMCYPSMDSPKALLEAEMSADGLGLPMKWATSKIDTVIKRHFQLISEEYTLHIRGKDLTPQESIKTRYFYLSSTMYYWTTEMIKGPNKVILFPYLVDYIIPFLLRLILQKETCQLAGIDAATIFLGIAYLPVRDKEMCSIAALMCAKPSKKESSHQLKLKLSFIQFFLSAHLLRLDQEQKNIIMEFIVTNLYNDKLVEVRDRAADVLSDIVHNIESEQALIQLISRFSSKLDGLTWEQKQEHSKTDSRIHGSVIGLGAIISAFPYVFPLPRWIPEQLSRLSSWARTNGVAGASAKAIIAEFKKVRTDTWQFDRTVFTSDELEDLEGVMWRSYYA
ncbi:uncharacterized protein KNAG_0D02640 [Huiozyma naganishii CBS 8797]|uniref:Proteasome activator BLM10 n=1 Tax=Huiozyma naganishii (strain ATCC MYA-139 / BCRC 22969 / CBS 8797 / KCTC 17520 / NBRC 10181 / NCYC 3082 / Yp74L-3) TaxID=1071383 RepID=J7RKJ9_HUIN7|nr:hypothetical protein KNAG_0D02640 [Kazachstania naganishii CBS 8797]CCK70013.1 hypothetical protein KNAG_0D02640 [Kazachstania naganishii CBS 8797]